MKKITMIIMSFIMSMSIGVTAFASPSEDISYTHANINNIIRDQVSKDNDFKMIYDLGDGNFSFTSNNNVDNKEIQSKLNLFNNKLARGYFPTASKDILIFKASSGTTASGTTYTTGFSTSTTTTGIGELLKDSQTTFSGGSYQNWMSSVPNADSIDASDTFSIGYIGTSASFSYPPGLSVQSSGSSATLSYPQISNNSIYQHYYNNFTAKAYGIVSVSQTSAATFRYGNRTFSVSAFDSSLISN